MAKGDPDVDSWNVRHFHSFYHGDHGGERGYTWVKLRLQEAGVVPRARARGKHRRRRERAPLPGMLLHQDGSRHEWVPGQWWDLIVTMDDATGEHRSMFLCEEEGTDSSFHGIGQTIAGYGLFCALYSDRGSHYFHTPEAGGPIDRSKLTRLGRAQAQLGIEHIAAYSPEARGRSERAFGTHQKRLPRELARAGITTIGAANRYLEQVYRPRHNAESAVPAVQPGTAFVPFIGGSLPDILCEHHERVVGNDNCVRFEGRCLQIPADGGGITTSSAACGCTATSMTAWRSSTGRGGWLAMMPREGFAAKSYRWLREASAARSARGQTGSGFALPGLPA